MNVLEARGVHAGYGRTPVLSDVDLVVPPGAAVALLGANGAGKTTMLRAIAGLLPTSRGELVFLGRPLGRAAPHVRVSAGICLIPEGRGIFRNLTVAENLAMHVRGRAASEATERAISHFPVLGQRLSQVAGTLSGGQQQMLAVARALLTDPRLLMIDELSVGLAPVVVDEIFEAIDVIRDSGRSLLIVEQYVHRALALADYVYILHKGRVVFVGEPNQCVSGSVFERYLGEGVA
jgi:branched-chain amino acid transport system ATP-binding protein